MYKLQLYKIRDWTFKTKKIFINLYKTEQNFYINFNKILSCITIDYNLYVYNFS